jgi:hypothetical protein
MHIHLLRRLMIIHFIDQVTRQASYLTCPFLTAFPFEHLRLSRSASTTTVAAASAEWQIIIAAIEFSRLFKMCYRISEDTDQTFKTEEFSQFLFSQGHCCAICVFQELFPFIIPVSTVPEKYLPCIAAFELGRHSSIRDTDHQAIQALVPR